MNPSGRVQSPPGSESDANMKTTTLDLIKSVLKTDETIPTDERSRIIRMLTTPADTTPRPPTRIVSFVEAAQRLAVKRRTIYHYCRAGILARARLPGKGRARGVTEESLLQAIGT